MADTEPTSNHSITDFISAFKGGTRQNRFVVTGTISSASRGGSITTTPFHIRSA